jgi:hypothetical protein
MGNQIGREIKVFDVHSMEFNRIQLLRLIPANGI